MKVHIGADVNSGEVHSAEVTAANEADTKVLPEVAAGAATQIWKPLFV